MDAGVGSEFEFEEETISVTEEPTKSYFNYQTQKRAYIKLM